MTFTDYARHRNVSKMTISRAVQRGRLQKCIGVDATTGRKYIADVSVADREWSENSDYTDAPQRLVPTPVVAVVDEPATDEEEPQPADAEVGEGSLATAAARAKHWTAKLAELKYREASKELIPARDVERRLTEVFTACRARLMGLPSKAKQALPHLTPADVGVLEATVRGALGDLAKEPAE